MWTIFTCLCRSYFADLYGTCTNANNGGCYRLGQGYNNIPPIMSARLRSYRRFSYTHGRAVVRAKMPVGDWIWPGRCHTRFISLLNEASVLAGSVSTIKYNRLVEE